MGLGLYDSLGEYCGPRTACSASLILIFTEVSEIFSKDLLSIDNNRSKICWEKIGTTFTFYRLFLYF